MSLRQGHLVAWAVVVTVGLGVRVHAAIHLPLDHDEPITLLAAEAYADAFPEGGRSLGEVQVNLEHPAAVKVAYGLGVLAVGENATRRARIGVCRGISLAFSVGLVGLVAWLHPAVGLLAALHPLHIKYGTQVYLEAMPGTLAALGVWLWFWQPRIHRVLPWLLLGMAAAGKYLYGVPGLLLAGWHIRTGRSAGLGLPYILAGPVVLALSFWGFNPQLWLDPFGSLGESLSLHVQYANSLHVEKLAGGPGAVLANLAWPVCRTWHPTLPWISVEPLFFVLGIWALVQGWRQGEERSRFLAMWAGTAFLVLLAWPTRWPHHVMSVLPPLFLGTGSWYQSRTRE